MRVPLNMLKTARTIISEDRVPSLIISAISKYSKLPLTQMSNLPEFRGKDFWQIMKSADVLIKKGILSKTQNPQDGIIYKEGPAFSKKASYNTDTYLILVGDTHTVHSFSRIFDEIHLNGCSGHSFGLVLKKGFSSNEEPILKAGFFDGDGAHHVSYICVGTEGKKLLGDNVLGKVKTTYSKIGSNYGNSILIVKGSECGIEALKDILCNVLNVAETSKEFVKIYTDDNPEICCGSFSMIEEEEKDGFGFFLITQQKLRDPVGFIRKNGYTLEFYRG